MEDDSNWSITFVPNNRSVSPSLMVDRGLKFKIRFRKYPPQLLKIEENATKTYSDVS